MKILGRWLQYTSHTHRNNKPPQSIILSLLLDNSILVQMPEMKWFDKMEWEDTPRGYYLTDVKQKTIYIDEKTGATLALIKYPPGVADKLHTHPEANQFFFPLSGEVEMKDGSMFIPKADGVQIQFKGEKHGRTNFTKETIVYVYWDGSPKPEVVE